ncbi:AAA family ATPase [Candidatus Minimicrobia naudis]|uniref:AAA family ATPase n=1 Tax=Candidatus Minimicrobia naudis TaxID=2841263 RepID=A0A8F1MBQ7_9BACT|nr:AAA family ATPase [Candidatus Minimicrobia naudis]
MYLAAAFTTKLAAHEGALGQMLKTFSSGGRQNITLVGADGAGKSTVVSAFAEMLIDGHRGVPGSLMYQQVFMLDASSLISVASGRGELENLVTMILNEAFLSKNVILCLDNAQLFFEEGVGSVDLSNVLLPILEAGRLRTILTMDDQRFLQISQTKPQLAHALNTIAIQPSNEPETMKIMRDQLVLFEAQHKVTYMYQALAEAYRVGDRYVQDLVMPGKALKILEAAASYASGGLVTAQSVDDAIEKTLGIKISVASLSDEKEKLLNLESLIHQRMINQTRAVTVVSDAIRRARTGVRNQNRPIGAFLFLGPTGVGKTELSKALADVYFGGEGNMIRLDLNEFVRPDDVARLIADGARDPGSLTAQVQKRPFSVVLLDEIEKAHPQVLTTLLQLLDEGILRDENNREISFRDTIVIATSNAGADRIREYIERGYQLEQFEQTFINELINANLFRPEFLNRFDEIVLFRPLGKEELLQVVDLILAGVNKTLAPQKIQVAVEEEGKKLLVEAGYDPRLGARPMRRVVQRAVENTVAKQMLAGTVAPGSTTIITTEQIRQILSSRAPRVSVIPVIPPVSWLSFLTIDLANFLLNGATVATATVPTPLIGARALALKRSLIAIFGFAVSIFGDSDQNASRTALAPSARLLFVLPAIASAKLVRAVKLMSYWSILLFLSVACLRDFFNVAQAFA